MLMSTDHPMIAAYGGLQTLGFSLESVGRQPLHLQKPIPINPLGSSHISPARFPLFNKYAQNQGQSYIQQSPLIHSQQVGNSS